MVLIKRHFDRGEANGADTCAPERNEDDINTNMSFMKAVSSNETHSRNVIPRLSPAASFSIHCARQWQNKASSEAKADGEKHTSVG